MWLGGALSSTKLSTVQKCQNRGFNLIESSRIEITYKTRILDVRELMMFDRVVMIFKVVNELCPQGFQNKVIERSTLLNYNT